MYYPPGRYFAKGSHFGRGPAALAEDIDDGTSNTLFLGEKPREDSDLGWASGTRSTLRNTGTRLNATGVVAVGFNPAVEDDDEANLAAATSTSSNRGSRKLKNAALGLRQKSLRSKRNCSQASPMVLTRCSGLPG